MDPQEFYEETEKMMEFFNQKVIEETEFERHFEFIVDKIDTEEWKSEWDCDPTEMVNKSKVSSALRILYEHNKPFTEKVLIRAIGKEAFNILTTLHVLTPWKNGIYYMNWHYSNKSKYPDSYFDNLGSNLFPKTVMGASMDNFIWLLSKVNYTTKEDGIVKIFISYETN